MSDSPNALARYDALVATLRADPDVCRTILLRRPRVAVWAVSLSPDGPALLCGLFNLNKLAHIVRQPSGQWCEQDTGLVWATREAGIAAMTADAVSHGYTVHA